VVLIPALAMLVALAQVPATEQRRPGAIRGVVDVRLDLPPLAQRPSVAELGASARPDTPDRRRSVVYLETAPQGAFEDHDRPHASLDQKNEAFFPYVLAISVGSTVDFPNRDRTYHNVFSLSKPQRFDLGRYAAGQSKSVRFDRPGVVRVFCDIHSHMSAYILVFAHRYFAVTDQAGAFTIAGVPPGSYTLAVWHEGEVRDTRTVTIPEAGGAVDAAFVIR
jgi:plastocyanin